MTPATQILVAALAAIAAVYDLRERRVPNALALAGFLAGAGVQGATSGPPGLVLALAGAAVALVVYLPLYALRVLGGGDVKLMAALGAIAGPGHWIRLFLCTALLGAVLAVALTASRGRGAQLLKSLSRIVGSLGRGRAPYADHAEMDVRNPQALRLPHAVTIACGTLAYLILYGAGILA